MLKQMFNPFRILYNIKKFNRGRKHSLFMATFNPNKSSKILDVGFSDKEYSPYDNYLEKNYLYRGNITALGIDEPKEFLVRYPDVRVVHYEGRKMPFADKEFDYGWSNAVIEHVGAYSNQLLFLQELCRTSKNVFITTPNKYFPLELHTRIPFLHYLPKKIFDKILTFIGKKWATGSYMNLLSLKKLERLLKDANIVNYKIVKNKILYFTMDYAIIIPENQFEGGVN